MRNVRNIAAHQQNFAGGSTGTDTPDCGVPAALATRPGSKIAPGSPAAQTSAKRDKTLRRLASVIAALLVFPAVLCAQDIAWLPSAQASALGMSPEEAYRMYGPPSYIYIEDGPASWQDDIVFYYSDNSYMYWFNSRVWQIRFDNRHRDPVFGVRMGTNMEAARAALGKPLSSSATELLYPVGELDFPVRAKFVFSTEGLINVYIYRSDF